MPLSQEMQGHLRSELETHDGCHPIALCLYLTVVAACYMSDTDFEEEVWEEARVFLLDEIMTACILKGAIEPGGMDENGEFTYQVTDWGRSQAGYPELGEDDG